MFERVKSFEFCLSRTDLIQGYDFWLTPLSERLNADFDTCRGNKDVTRVKDWFVTPGAENELLSSMKNLEMAKPTGQSSKSQAKTKAYLLEKKMRELNLNKEEAAKQIGWRNHEAWEIEKDARPMKMTMEEFARRSRGDEEVEGDGKEDVSAVESGDGEMEEGDETGDDWEAQEGRLQVKEAAMRNVPLDFE